jgi:hypothetical protein
LKICSLLAANWFEKRDKLAEKNRVLAQLAKWRAPPAIRRGIVGIFAHFVPPRLSAFHGANRGREHID